MIEYKSLKESFSKYGFHFKLIKRTKKKAIFQQSSNNKIVAYETILISRHDGFSLAGNYIEPAETYPSSSEWGTKGFTYKTLQQAEEKYKEL